MRMCVANDFALADILEKIVFTMEPTAKPRAANKTAAWDVPGFLGKTRIRTTQGEVPVASLRVDDEVLTTSGTTLRIKRIDRINLDPNFLHCHPEAQPIHIAANALGRGLPERDLVVSAGQELAFATGALPRRRMKAGEISGNSSVMRAMQGALTYHVIEFDRPAYVFAEGVPVLIPVKTECDEGDSEE